MSPVERPALYVGFDDWMIIVSSAPVAIDGGKADVDRWGPVRQVSPAEVGDARPLAHVGRITVTMLVLTACWVPVGQAWRIAFAIMAVGGWVGLEHWIRRQRPGLLVAPGIADRRSDYHVLVDDDDRLAFASALDVGRRIVASSPPLRGLAAPDIGAPLLADALRELAGLLERRQSTRELRAELAGQQLAGLPADNPTVLGLRSRQARVDAALTALDAAVRDQVAALAATAIAGESFTREQQVRTVSARIDRELDRLVPVDLPGRPADPGTELADRTDAVLTAYRELADGTDAVLTAYRELDHRYRTT